MRAEMRAARGEVLWEGEKGEDMNPLDMEDASLARNCEVRVSRRRRREEKRQIRRGEEIKDISKGKTKKMDDELRRDRTRGKKERKDN